MTLQFCAAGHDADSSRSGRPGHRLVLGSGSGSGEEAGVPYVDNGGARIWYTAQGTGFAMLTLAPGGMRSSCQVLTASGGWPGSGTVSWPAMIPFPAAAARPVAGCAA